MKSAELFDVIQMSDISEKALRRKMLSPSSRLPSMSNSKLKSPSKVVFDQINNLTPRL